LESEYKTHRVPLELIRIKDELSSFLFNLPGNDYTSRNSFFVEETSHHLHGGFEHVGGPINNVVAVGIGLPNGQFGDDFTIHVFLNRLVEPYYDSFCSMISEKYSELNSRYRIIFKLASQPTFAACKSSMNYSSPLKAGLSCSADLINNIGTLGFFCKLRSAPESSDIYICSNNHVLSALNTLPIGYNIVHPSNQHADPNQANIGYLYDSIMMHSGANMYNYVDAAVAKLDSSVQYDTDICCIGPVNGYTSPNERMSVHKHGCKTGYTIGEVKIIRTDVQISSGGVDYMFKDQIYVESTSGGNAFADKGDSGSLVLSVEDNDAVGLLFATTDDGSAFINPIEYVLNQLDIDIV